MSATPVPAPLGVDAHPNTQIDVIDEKPNDIENRANSIPEDDPKESSSDDEFKQQGVKDVEAITRVWSTKLLILTFILLWLVSFVDSLLQSVQGNLVPYITSNFHKHGLLSSTGIVATIIGGLCNLTIAKVIDIWGRVYGFVVMIVFIVIGMVIKATCQNVEAYAAGHTLFWVGHIGLLYIISIVVADMTTIRKREIIMGINGLPTICTVFAGPKIAERFYNEVNFRWAFGAFSFILVFFAIPVVAVFIYAEMKAKKMGVIRREPSGRTIPQSLKYYAIQFDIVGLFFTTVGWCLLLLPFSIAEYAPHGWKSGYIIAMIVLGVVFLVAFGIWEKYFATIPYFPWKYLKDRTILGACLNYGIMFCSIYCWDTYYGSYLQVVHNESISVSGYVLNAFSLMSAFIGPFVGLAIAWYGRFKWPSMAGIPFCVLGTVLLLHFRKPETKVNYLVMCQLFNGVYSGIWSTTSQLAVMASVGHQEVAVALALFGMFGSIGAAVGMAISGAIWTNILPQKLTEYLPEAAKNQSATIYGDITVPLALSMDDPVRVGTMKAYQVVQEKMVQAGSAFIPFMILVLFMFRNIDLREKDAKSKQAKGNVF